VSRNAGLLDTGVTEIGPFGLFLYSCRRRELLTGDVQIVGAAQAVKHIERGLAIGQVHPPLDIHYVAADDNFARLTSWPLGSSSYSKSRNRAA